MGNKRKTLWKTKHKKTRIDFFRLQIVKGRGDATGINCSRNENSSAVVEPESVKKWKKFIERLMKVENTLDGRGS